jgi:hypothetical protein
MVTYRVTTEGERLVVAQTTFMRIYTIILFVSGTVVTAVGYWVMLHDLRPTVSIVTLALLVTAACAVMARVAFDGIRHANTFVFDRSMDRVLHNGRPTVPLAAIRSISCRSRRYCSVVLCGEDGKALGSFQATFYECPWLAKAIAEHLAVPWSAPDRLFERPVRDSWRRGLALLVTVGPAVAIASALAVEVWQQARRPALKEYRCTVIAKTVARTGRTYAPQFTLAIAVPPRTITFQPGTGAEEDVSTPSRGPVDRILGTYALDHAYPCWYGEGHGPFLARRAVPWPSLAGLVALLPVAIVLGRRAYRSLDAEIARGVPPRPPAVNAAVPRPEYFRSGS